jgi:hypothetical protein
MIKTPLILVAQFLHFALIGLPLAITLYLTAHLFFELKRIIKWIKN